MYVARSVGLPCTSRVPLCAFCPFRPVHCVCSLSCSGLVCVQRKPLGIRQRSQSKSVHAPYRRALSFACSPCRDERTLGSCRASCAPCGPSSKMPGAWPPRALSPARREGDCRPEAQKTDGRKRGTHNRPIDNKISVMCIANTAWQASRQPRIIRSRRSLDAPVEEQNTNHQHRETQVYEVCTTVAFGVLL